MVTTTNYIYDGFQLLGEADETGTLTRRYINEPDDYTHPIGHVDVDTGESSYYHYDGQGNTRAVTDENENVTDTFTFDSWGNLLARTGMTNVPFQFGGEHGYYKDEELDTYYVMERVYDSSIIRWLSVDPLQSLDSSYLYVLNNPTRYLDLAGFLPVVFDDDAEGKEARERICKQLKAQKILAFTACTFEGVTIYNCDDTCTSVCTQAHEEVHKSEYSNKNHPLGKCCKSLQSSGEGLTDEQKQDLYNRFRKWLITNIDVFECPGYRKELECLTALRRCALTWRGEECKALRDKLKKLRPDLFEDDGLNDTLACAERIRDRINRVTQLIGKHCPGGKPKPDPDEPPPKYTECPDFTPQDEC